MAGWAMRTECRSDAVIWGGGNVRRLLGGRLQGEMPELGEEAMDDGAIRETSRLDWGVGVRGGEVSRTPPGIWV